MDCGMSERPPKQSTPEERLEAPLKWCPKDPSKESLEQLKAVLEVAVSNEMISSTDANRMLRILEVNPAAQLARLGQRLTIIEKTAQDLSGLEQRIQFAAKSSRKELERLDTLITGFFQETNNSDE